MFESIYSKINLGVKKGLRVRRALSVAGKTPPTVAWHGDGVSNFKKFIELSFWKAYTLHEFI